MCGYLLIMCLAVRCLGLQTSSWCSSGCEEVGSWKWRDWERVKVTCFLFYLFFCLFPANDYILINLPFQISRPATLVDGIANILLNNPTWHCTTELTFSPLINFAGRLWSWWRRLVLKKLSSKACPFFWSKACAHVQGECRSSAQPIYHWHSGVPYELVRRCGWNLCLLSVSSKSIFICTAEAGRWVPTTDHGTRLCRRRRPTGGAHST